MDKLTWKVGWCSDLSALYLDLTPYDPSWGLSVESTRLKDGRGYDVWFDITNEEYPVHIGVFSSIAEARDVAQALLEQWLVDNGQMATAMAIDPTLPENIDQDYREPTKEIIASFKSQEVAEYTREKWGDVFDEFEDLDPAEFNLSTL